MCGHWYCGDPDCDRPAQDPAKALLLQFKDKRSEIDAAMNEIDTIESSRQLIESLKPTLTRDIVIDQVKQLQNQTFRHIGGLNKNMAKLADELLNFELDEAERKRKDDDDRDASIGGFWSGEKLAEMFEHSDCKSSACGSDESDTDVELENEIEAVKLELDGKTKEHKQLCDADLELRVQERDSNTGKKALRKLAAERKQIEKQKGQMSREIKQIRKKLNKLESSKNDKAQQANKMQQGSKRSQKARKIVTPSVTEDHDDVFDVGTLRGRGEMPGLAGWGQSQQRSRSRSGWNNDNDCVKW